MRQILAIFFVLVFSSANAALIVDQVQDSNLIGQASFGTNGFERSQTFTSALAGVLSAIDLRIVQSGGPSSFEFVLSIFNTLDGIPSETALTSKTMSSTLFPQEIIDPNTGGVTNFDWTTLDISDLGIAVAPGEVLAFGLGEPEGQPFGGFTINVGA